MTKIPECKFLTFEELAAKWRISVRTLQRIVKAGNAPSHIRVGKRVLFLLPSEDSND